MRANKVDFSLGNGSHSNLIQGTGEEGSKCRHNDNVPVTATESNPDAHHVLLGNETLDKSLGATVLVGEGERGVLGVTIKSYDSGEVLSQLHQSLSICLPSGYLNTINFRGKMFHI